MLCGLDMIWMGSIACIKIEKKKIQAIKLICKCIGNFNECIITFIYQDYFHGKILMNTVSVEIFIRLYLHEIYVLTLCTRGKNSTGN